MNKLDAQHTSLPPEILAQRVQEMEDIARQLAAATEEADRSLVKLQSLYDVSRELSGSLNVAEIMEKTTSHLTLITHAHSSALWNISDSTASVQSAYGLPPEVASDLLLFSSSSSSIFTAVHTRQFTTIRRTLELSAGDRQLLHNLDAAILLALPLVVHDTLLGLVTLHGRDTRLLQDRDLIQAVVQQAAIAIQNGRLYEEVQQLNQTLERRIDARTRELVREKEQLETMYEITACLTNTLDPQRMIDQTLRQLADATNAQDGLIMMNDDSFSSQLYYTASLNTHPLNTPPTGLDHNIGHWVMTNRRSLLVHDLQEAPQWTDLSGDAACRSVIAAPLMADRDLHGVLMLADDEAYRFTQSHIRLVESVAAQLASAINNAKLHEYVREQVIRLGDMLHAEEIEAGQKQAFLASIADGVIASNTSGDVLLVNPKAEEILGQTEANLIGQSVQVIFDTFDDMGRDKLRRAFDILRRHGRAPAANEEMRELVLELDRRVINARLTPVTTKYETIGIVVVLRDITREVEAAKAKSEFISTVSHELRTPMTSIKGYTDLMRRGMVGDLNEKQTHFLDVVYRNADRLSLLINDLLDVSRIEAGKIKLDLRDLNLGEVAHQVVESLIVPAENKGLQLTFDPDPDLPLVKADHDRMVQVMTNLIGNAINYTERGAVHVRVAKVSDAVQVSVKDSGIGISGDEINHIFERFYRSDSDVVQANSGTGLGLSIVHDFVEMHEGRIWVDSTVGEGSTFSFILPLPDK